MKRKLMVSGAAAFMAVLASCILFKKASTPTSPMYIGTCSVASCGSDLVSAYHVNSWFWDSPVVYDETILPLSGKTTYSMWRPIASIQQVRNRQTGRPYAPNVDYRIANGQLVIPTGSSIPKTDPSWLTTADPTNPPAWQPVTKEGTPLRITSGGYQPRQIAVTYTAAASSHTAPSGPGAKIFLGKLAAHQSVNLIFAGDSITEGDDSTAVDKQSPGQPGYAELVTAYLAQLYPGQINANNVSVPGEGSTYFAQHLSLLSKPADLVVIAIGMNDPPAGITPSQFRSNIMAMIGAVRTSNPESEIVLVASWPSNSDWVMSNNELLNQYRTVENSIAAGVSNVFVADLETISNQILARKTYYDVTGNGVAHPNDFMYVVFAQILLRTIFGA